MEEKQFKLWLQSISSYTVKTLLRRTLADLKKRFNCYGLQGQGKQIIKNSTCPDYHGYGKNDQNALQILKYPLTLQQKSLARATGRVNIL